MLTLVIPVFNEEVLIDELVKRSISAVESFTGDYEVIFVDDGSTDLSLQKLLDWQKGNSRIKIISLSRNFGHQAAFTAGLEYSRGDLVAMMDGDLQDPPELLAEMHRKIKEEGYEIVNGKKIGRKGNRRRNLSACLFHHLFRKMSDIRNMENYGNFSMMTRNAADALIMIKEKIRYMPGLRSFIGFKQCDVEFVREDRYSGDSKMSFRKLFYLGTDAIFSISSFPIRFCLVLGAISTTIFMMAGIYVIVAGIAGFALPGRSSILLSIYFLGSVQLVFLGVLGEYVFRGYKEAQNRPVYFVRKFYDGSREEG